MKCCKQTNYGGFAFAPKTREQELLDLQNQVDQFNLRRKFSAPGPVPIFSFAFLNPTIENRLIELINQFRVDNGLNTVTTDNTAKQQAQGHALFMAETQQLSNVGFEVRKARIQNVYPGSTVQELNQQDLFHPHDNPVTDPIVIANQLFAKMRAQSTLVLLGDFTLFGVGAAQTHSPYGVDSFYTYSTVIFVKP